MAKSDISVWTFVGILFGMITAYYVNKDYSILGAIGGGIIGYMLGRAVR